jgi:hypothetical protein
MYINPIHAGAVAQAQALAAAARVSAVEVSRRKHRFQPLQWLATWLLQPDNADARAPDPAQLMLWSECAGRNYVTVFGGVLVMKQLHQRTGQSPTPPEV